MRHQCEIEFCDSTGAHVRVSLDRGSTWWDFWQRDPILVTKYVPIPVDEFEATVIDTTLRRPDLPDDMIAKNTAAHVKVSLDRSKIMRERLELERARDAAATPFVNVELDQDTSEPIDLSTLTREEIVAWDLVAEIMANGRGSKV